MPLAEAKKIFTQGIIGVSCYGSIAKAKEAQDEGADYVAFGSFFHSPTKPKSGIVPQKTLQKARENIDIPLCAIGGINQDNIHEIAQFQPQMISVVSAVFAGNIKENVQKLIKGMTL
jgi:thiamine-phosphate pyrophosphorylase